MNKAKLLVALLFVSATLPNGGALAETATWYGGKFCHRKTASGERMNCGAMTAAHPSLPFGTRVALRNPHNGRTIVVRINDRKPGGGIDLTPTAGRRLDMISRGRVPVRMRVVGRYN